MGGTLTPLPRFRAVDTTGAPIAGAKLTTYAAGSTTPLQTYSDPDLQIGHLNANPVVSDAFGLFGPIYLTAAAYKMVLTKADDTSVWSQDNVFDLFEVFNATPVSANRVYAGPASGSSAAPTFRALTGADLGAQLDIGVCEGRLTLTSGTPVTTADVLAATTIFFTPYKGNRVALYNGTTWAISTFAELSWPFGTVTANTPYDLFIFTTGTVQLMQVPWTNATTRGTALVLQDGVWVQDGDTTKRYIGTFFPATTTTVEDSYAKRYLWNYYNRVARPMRVLETTNTWAYTLATYRQANAAAANQLDCVIGVAEVLLEAEVVATFLNTDAAVDAAVSIGIDSTSEPATGVIASNTSSVVSNLQAVRASLKIYPAIGRHIFPWLEYSVATGTTTWRGDNPVYVQSGIQGVIEG